MHIVLHCRFHLRPIYMYNRNGIIFLHFDLRDNFLLTKKRYCLYRRVAEVKGMIFVSYSRGPLFRMWRLCSERGGRDNSGFGNRNKLRRSRGIPKWHPNFAFSAAKRYENGVAVLWVAKRAVGVPSRPRTLWMQCRLTSSKSALHSKSYYTCNVDELLKHSVPFWVPYPVRLSYNICDHSTIALVLNWTRFSSNMRPSTKTFWSKLKHIQLVPLRAR